MPEKMPFSYHTFLFPFLWDNDGHISREAFLKALPDGWKKDAIVRENADGENKPAALSREGYATYQYFSAAARKALFLENEKESIVDCRFYEPLDHAGQYIISKAGREYALDINGVRLKVFNTGVAVMAFELEYRTKLPSEKALENVMMINEYGRRLYPPFLPQDSRFLLCADKLVISAGELRIEDSFLDRTRSSSADVCDCDYAKNPHLMPGIVTSLLGDSMSSEPGAEGKLYIEPAIDDRMFVCCCVADGAVTDHFLGYSAYVPDDDAAGQKEARLRRQAGEWAFRTDYELGRELYALLNIDDSRGNSSCNSRKDLDRYFDEQLYTRWMEYGTLFGVTNHSLLCLTGKHEFVAASVINPFLTLYTQMCILVLAQRASLISFDKQVSRVAATKLRMPWERESLVRLQKDFSEFQSELLPAEITPQIQGIELYARLQSMLFVPQLEANIENRMKNLFELVQASQGETLNYGGLLIAVAALFMALYQGSAKIEPDRCTVLVTLAVTLLPVLILWLCGKLLRRRRK